MFAVCTTTFACMPGDIEQDRRVVSSASQPCLQHGRSATAVIPMRKVVCPVSSRPSRRQSPALAALYATILHDCVPVSNLHTAWLPGHVHASPSHAFQCIIHLMSRLRPSSTCLTFMGYRLATCWHKKRHRRMQKQKPPTRFELVTLSFELDRTSEKL